MKILTVHNFYQLHSGEEKVITNEINLLENNNHSIIFYKKYNEEINKFSVLKKAALLWETSYSKKTYDEVSEIIKNEKPDICHVHNFLPLISPSIYFACKSLKVPVVQTLHNYRLFCTNGMFFRNGHICEECLNNSAYNSLKYNCYRNSKIQTYAVARMIEQNKKKGTWENLIDAFICPTNFVYEKFIEGNFPEEKLFIKPHFLINDPVFSENDENYFLYVGRLDTLKGINLISSLSNNLKKIKIKLIGDGSKYQELKQNKNLEILGKKSYETAINYIKNCIALIFPSITFETFGLSIIEAFACGKPVIASRLGVMEELIEDGETGLLFEPGNTDELSEKIIWANENKDNMKIMGMNARKEYEKKYTAKKNYEILIDIYNKVLEKNRDGFHQ